MPLPLGFLVTQLLGAGVGALARGFSGPRVLTLHVDSNLPAIATDLGRFGSDHRVALQRAVNRAVDAGRTEMARRIAGQYKLGVNVVRQRLRTKRATRSNITALLFVDERKRSLNVVRFREGVARRVAGGVQVRIRRDRGRQVIKGSFQPKAGGAVFRRAPGAKRFPIEPVQTIGVPQMFNTKEIRAQVIRHMEGVALAEYERQMKLAVAKFGRSGSAALRRVVSIPLLIR